MDRLSKIYPHVRTELRHRNTFELLVATILSAQCTDARVNQVTPALFARYPTPFHLVSVDREAVETLIHSTGFYKSKARHIIGCATGLVERFGGQVPDTLEALITLPGVGRKTANVVLGTAFGQPAVVVDTHVRRVTRRMKWTRADNPDQIEHDLERLLLREEWTEGAHRLLLHGRYTCVARNPRCLDCRLSDLCPAEAEKRRAQTRDGRALPS
jgi:endonuclease-3